MPARHLNAKQREAHLAAVSDLYRQGTPMFRIAERLGVSGAQISYDVAKLRARWATACRRDGEEWTAEMLAKIDRLEEEAWVAWERSKQEREHTATERTVIAPGSQQPVTAGQQPVTAGKQGDKASVRRARRDPNASYLATVQWCISERCKILGLYEQPDAATQVNILIHPQWVALRAVVVDALDAFPDARVAVLQALEATDG